MLNGDAEDLPVAGLPIVPRDPRTDSPRRRPRGAPRSRARGRNRDGRAGESGASPKRRPAPMRPFLALLALLAVVPARAAERPVVLELFTSQGCSSCPPADAFVTDLARERPDLLPLTFHVTSWNGLGWHDPLSLPEATARQAGDAARFDGVSFTPQLVIDGRESVVGSDREAAGRAIARARAAREKAAPAGAAPAEADPEGADRQAGPALTLRRGPDGIAVAVGAGPGEGRLILVGFDRAHRTPVRRGENAGRTLTESNVVRAIRDLGSWRGAPLRLVHPAPAGEDAAILLQAPDGRILAAARLAPIS